MFLQVAWGTDCLKGSLNKANGVLKSNFCLGHKKSPAQDRPRGLMEFFHAKRCESPLKPEQSNNVLGIPRAFLFGTGFPLPIPDLGHLVEVQVS